jgi:monovalent cation:proton antiporter-2 (CPA2) family protein
MFSGLELTLLLLATAVLGVVAFRMLNLPPMLGYLVVGIALGPHALGATGDTAATHGLAEYGVVFLMFSIGLEFSLPKLLSMRRIVFGLGLAQVLLTIGAAMAFGWASAYLLPQFIQINWQASFALGGALAMSSTAIVSKMLTERVELETAHGQRIIGVLLFQDLALVPLLIIVPALASDRGNLFETLAWASGKALVVLALLLFFGNKLMRGWFQIVVKRRSQELFMLNLLLVTLGAAWITERAGLSLALGAFVAGMLISETEYKHQVEEDIKSFRDVLLGLFFITIGMLLNVRIVIEHWPLVLFLLTVPVLLKLGLITALAKIFGASTSVALRTGLGLAQAGEFDSGLDGVVDADDAADLGEIGRHRHEAGGQRMDAAVAGADAAGHAHDDGQAACDHRRFRPQRTAPGQIAGRRGHRLSGAGTGSRAGAGHAAVGSQCFLRRRLAPRVAGGGRHTSRLGRGGDLRQHAVGAEGAAPCQRVGAGIAGDRAQP